MILSLVGKEYVEAKENASKSTIAVKWILTVLLYAFFVALEVYIFIAINNKLDEMSSYGSFDFICVYLFAITIISSIMVVNKARISIFKEKDRLLLSKLPITSDDIVISKVIYIYLKEVANSLILAAPILITYGALHELKTGYYIFSCLYPFFISFFSIGVTMIILIPYNYIYNFLKKRYILQIIVSSILVIGLCFVYKYVLELFLNIVNNSKLDYLFSESFMESINKTASYLIPVSSYLKMITTKTNLVSNTSIFIGVCLLFSVIGFFLASSLLKKSQFATSEETSSGKIKIKKIKTAKKALISKELMLIFRNSNFIFTYTALIIMQPFLTLVVITSLNKLLYDSLEMFLIYYPEMINGINICIILLFSSIIGASSIEPLSREGKGLLTVKQIPISPITQTLIKISITSIISIFSLLISNIVLIGTSTISATVFWISLGIGILFTIELNILGLFLDLRRLDVDKKANMTYLSAFVSFAFPLLLGIIHFVLTFIRVNATYIYLIEFGLAIIVMIPLILMYKKIVNDGFTKMRGELL